jgi:RNA polymerase sigma-70 factor (ECF subfamily)
LQDELLIKRLKKHDIEAFEIAINDYKNYVGAIVKSRIALSMEPEDVEEVVADVFFALWKQCDNLDAKKGSVKNYLGMLARNMSVNKLRERSNTVILDESIYNQATETQTPELEVLQKEAIGTIYAEINLLKTPDKEIFIKYHTEGKSVNQIAEELNVNPSTVKVKLVRTRKKLRKQLSERGYCYEG